MQKLIVENDVIVNLIKADDDVSKQPQWVKDLPTATGSETIGWVSDGQGGFEAPALPLAAAKESKLTALSSLRWGKEQGGFTINGVVYKSSDRDRGMVADAERYLENSNRSHIRFKLANGSYPSIDLTQVRTIGVLIGDHIQSCFDREAELAEEINSATTLQELEAIDITVGWPA